MEKDPSTEAPAEAATAPKPREPAARKPMPREIGGVDGPEPTRYGDWQHKGRCTDF